MAFFSDQFLRGVLFFAVGGVSSVAILKIWENRESLLREIRRRFDSNETWQPEEHDERFDWGGKRYNNNENIFLCVENFFMYVGSYFSMRLKTLSGMLVLFFKDFFEISELEHGKCSNRKNNRVLLARIKETNMFLWLDQLTNVDLITQNNSLTLIFFNQVKEQARNMIVRNSTRSERRVSAYTNRT